MSTPANGPQRPPQPRTPAHASTETPAPENGPHTGVQRIHLDDLTSNQLDILYDLLETLIAAGRAREADREETRDALEAAGHPSAHIDDWPRIAPAVHALITERDALASDLAELTAARQHGAYTFCDQQIGHVTVAEFARKISEKRNAIARAKQAEAERDALRYRLDSARDAAALHRQGLIASAELYAAIEAPATPTQPNPDTTEVTR